MKKTTILTVAVAVTAIYSAAFAAAKSGETIFKEKCASCHPGGGNIMNPKKTLKGIKKADTITQQIRKGGGGMPVFDTTSVSNTDAKLLSEYIMKTFKK